MPEDDSFVPKTRIAGGGPIGRQYWGLPVTSLSTTAASNGEPIGLYCDLLEQNIKRLEEALNRFAREQVLCMEIHEGRRVTAHCCVQAIQTLRDVQDLLLAFRGRSESGDDPVSLDP